MKKINLIGKKFYNLTVIKEGVNKPSKSRKSNTTWECKCKCGKILTVRTNTLMAGKQKSCGCVVNSNGKLIKPGDKFNKLTAISYSNGKWICSCECGKNTNPILTHVLFAGKIKSCGCIKIETIKKNQKLSIERIRKYDPNIASARRRWKSYLYQDKNCNLTFDQWMDISQKNCHYCGSPPNNKINYFSSRKQSSEKGKLEGDFYCNGLDRVNSDGYHTIDNVVACCYTCNRAKSNRNLNKFIKYINNLKPYYHDNVIKNKQLPTGYILTSIKDAYRHYKRNYGTMELTIEDFYSYSQMPCVYCNEVGVNCTNTYLSDKKASEKAKNGAYFYYNGIDRLDITKGHTKENIVTCCKYCNFAKSNMTLEQFNQWIITIKNNQSINNE